MADSPVARWALSKRSSLEFRLTRLSWGFALTPRIFDYEASMTFEGNSYIGRGAAKTEELAIEKACSEVVERIVCRAHGISTEGVAVHPSNDQARSNSENEAVERSALSWHVSNRQPWFISESTAVAQAGLRQQIPNHFKANVFSMLSDDARANVAVIVSYASQKFMGFACGSNVDRAAAKGLIEALRNATAFAEDSLSYQKEMESNGDLWSGNPAYISRHSFLFSVPSTKNICGLFQTKSSQLSFEGLDLLSDCPVTAYRSFCSVEAV